MVTNCSWIEYQLYQLLLDFDPSPVSIEMKAAATICTIIFLCEHKCFTSNIIQPASYTTTLRLKLHQSHISPVGRRLMATESAKDAMRPFHKVAATGSSWMRYLKKGTSSKVQPFPIPKEPDSNKTTSFFKFQDCLGLYPCSLQFFDIRFHLFLPAFLNRTAVSVHPSFSKVLKLAMDWMKTTTGIKQKKIRKITK